MSLFNRTIDDVDVVLKHAPCPVQYGGTTLYDHEASFNPAEVTMEVLEECLDQRFGRCP